MAATLGGVADHLARLAAALDVHPAELVGLLVLLVGGTVVSGVLWVAAASPTAAPAPGDRPPDITLSEDEPERLTVHVVGAVRRPGVVSLPAGARVGDAVQAAGGSRPDAYLGGLNLAALVEDGQQVVVPAAGAAGDPEAGVPAPAGSAVDAEGRVDLNRATAEDLEQLPGIGPVLARRILTWREEHGPFSTVGQLREVPGIGERTFQSLAELVRV